MNMIQLSVSVIIALSMTYSLSLFRGVEIVEGIGNELRSSYLSRS